MFFMGPLEVLLEFKETFHAAVVQGAEEVTTGNKGSKPPNAFQARQTQTASGWGVAGIHSGREMRLVAWDRASQLSLGSTKDPAAYWQRACDAYAANPTGGILALRWDAVQPDVMPKAVRKQLVDWLLAVSVPRSSAYRGMMGGCWH